MAVGNTVHGMKTDVPYDYSRFLGQLGLRIQRLRKSRKMSQERLGELIGVSRVYVGYIEQSREIPNLELLYNIASVLGVGLDELFVDIEIGAPTRNRST